MTRQTNIGLLLALIFIVAFSLVLTEFRQPAQDIEKQTAAKTDEDYYKNATPKVTMVRPTVRREARRAVRPENRVAVTPRPSAQREMATVTPVPAPAPAAVPAQTPAPARQAPNTAPIANRQPERTAIIRLPQTNTPPNYRERTIDEFAQDLASSQTPRNQQPNQRVYIVINGDNLRKISRKMYNSDNKWRKIYNANRSKLRNPNDIQVGMKLVIPEV